MTVFETTYWFRMWTGLYVMRAKIFNVGRIDLGRHDLLSGFDRPGSHLSCLDIFDWGDWNVWGVRKSAVVWCLRIRGVLSWGFIRWAKTVIVPVTTFTRIFLDEVFKFFQVFCPYMCVLKLSFIFSPVRRAIKAWGAFALIERLICASCRCGLLLWCLLIVWR